MPKPYEPQWETMTAIDTVSTVAQAMDRYYKADRLNRPGGTRERLIADREGEATQYGYTCIASFHDSTNGMAVYIRAADDGYTVMAS